jgi:predicted dehydrogenase
MNTQVGGDNPVTERDMERREFITTSAAAAAAGTSLLLNACTREEAGESEGGSSGVSVRLGVIGVGSRGQYMMRQFLRVRGVSIAALCDVYEPRFAEGRAITGENTPTFSDYRAMLETVRDLDAVLIATPLNFHAEHVLGALQTGLHVYGEKSMAFTVAECDAIVNAVRSSGLHYQVGLQYRYAPWFRQAVQRIREGEIGRVTHVYAYWHRNYNWRRPVPDASLERLINWRLYREYSHGLVAELGAHQIDAANWIFGETPSSVVGNGAITFYPDGRETLDNVQAIYSYPGGGTLVFSSIIGNHKQGFQVIAYGTGGTAELTLEDGFFFYEPARPNSAVPQELVEHGVNTTASLSTSGDMPYRGPGRLIRIDRREAGDPSWHAARAFVASMGDGTRPAADEIVAWREGTAVALGVEAVRNGSRIDFGGRGVVGRPEATA